MLSTFDEVRGLSDSELYEIDKLAFDMATKIKEKIRPEATSIICYAFVAYLVKANNLTTQEEIIEYCEKNFTEERNLFIRNYVNNWNSVFEIANEYSRELLLAIILFTNTSIDRFNGNRYETPECICSLAYEILNPGKETIADLGCGMGTFLTFAARRNRDASFYGIDVNAACKEIADIRLDVASNNYKVEQGTIFSLTEDNKFDKVFIDYPWGMKNSNSYIENEDRQKLAEIVPEVGKTTTTDWLFIVKSLQQLKDDGKAVVVTTNGVTWNSLYKNIRERMVKLGYIDAVISLPANLYPGIGIAVSLIVLSKSKKTSIRMIDASSFVSVGRRQNTLYYQSIMQIVDLLNSSDDTDVAKTISIDKIDKNDYSINPSRYMENEPVVKNGVPFGDVIKNVTRGAQMKASELDDMVSDEPTAYQYLMLANIQDGIISDNLPYIKGLDSKLEKYCLKNNCLVISKNGTPVKVAIADVSEGKHILANGNLYVIELDEEKANPLYVKAFLESEMGTIALNRVTVGAVMPNIPVEGLKKILIPLPSMEEQNKIAEKYLAKIDEIKVLRIRLNKAVTELKQIFKEE